MKENILGPRDFGNSKMSSFLDGSGQGTGSWRLRGNFNSLPEAAILRDRFDSFQHRPFGTWGKSVPIFWESLPWMTCPKFHQR
jgi:hypothetical protein